MSSGLFNERATIRIAIEELIKSGFKPTRSVVLAFGFDEEVSTGQVCDICFACLVG